MLRQCIRKNIKHLKKPLVAQKLVLSSGLKPSVAASYRYNNIT